MPPSLPSRVDSLDGNLVKSCITLAGCCRGQGNLAILYYQEDNGIRRHARSNRTVAIVSRSLSSDSSHPRKPGLVFLTDPQVEVRDIVQSDYFIDFTNRDCVTVNSATTQTIWEFQYNDPSVHSHQQLNGFVYSNICLYIPTTASNTKRAWLRSHP